MARATRHESQLRVYIMYIYIYICIDVLLVVAYPLRALLEDHARGHAGPLLGRDEVRASRAWEYYYCYCYCYYYNYCSSYY